MGFALSFVGIIVGVLIVRICLETCLSVYLIRDTVYSLSKEALQVRDIQKLVVREEEKQSEQSEYYTEESYEDSIYSDEEV